LLRRDEDIAHGRDASHAIDRRQESVSVRPAGSNFRPGG
jgi:hypothetical protein